jgi:hypothetical protein
MLGIIAAALMAASFFMPWLSFLGEEMSPVGMIGDQISLADLPWRGWAFVASFAIAGLAAFKALRRRRAGLLMLIAGAIPYGLIGEQMLGVRNQVQDLGLPLPDGGTPIDMIRSLADFIEFGLPAYFIAAALLIVIGLGRIMGRR